MLDAGGRSVTNVSVAVNATPGVVLVVQAVCSLWTKTGRSPPLWLEAASLSIAAASTLPTSFIPSDTAMPWPVTPSLVIATAATPSTGRIAVRDVVCSLQSQTATAQLIMAGATTAAGLANIPADVNGAVRFPPFIVQASFSTAAVAIAVSCVRPSGDGPPPRVLTLATMPLRVVVCDAPAAVAPSQGALPTFPLLSARRAAHPALLPPAHPRSCHPSRAPSPSTPLCRP